MDSQACFSESEKRKFEAKFGYHPTGGRFHVRPEVEEHEQSDSGNGYSCPVDDNPFQMFMSSPGASSRPECFACFLSTLVKEGHPCELHDVWCQSRSKDSVSDSYARYYWNSISTAFSKVAANFIKALPLTQGSSSQCQGSNPDDSAYDWDHDILAMYGCESEPYADPSSSYLGKERYFESPWMDMVARVRVWRNYHEQAISPDERASTEWYPEPRDPRDRDGQFIDPEAFFTESEQRRFAAKFGYYPTGEQFYMPPDVEEYVHSESGDCDTDYSSPSWSGPIPPGDGQEYRLVAENVSYLDSGVLKVDPLTEFC
jgi:hypothetical protein